MKAAGQDMNQKAANELTGVQAHAFIALGAFYPVVLVFELDWVGECSFDAKHP